MLPSPYQGDSIAYWWLSRSNHSTTSPGLWGHEHVIHLTRQSLLRLDLKYELDKITSTMYPFYSFEVAPFSWSAQTWKWCDKQDVKTLKTSKGNTFNVLIRR
jgi:hypothetical protein